MEPPKSISYEVFELFNRIIDQANRIDRLIRSLEDKNKRYEDVIFQFETFATNVKNNLNNFVENTHFQIEKSLNLYTKEHDRVVAFFNENEKTKELYNEAHRLYNQLGDLKLKYDNLTSQFSETYQKYQSMLDNLSEKANRHFETVSKELKEKIDIEIQKKVDRDLKTIETNILLKNKLLEGKVSELNNSVNTLYSILQLPEFQSLFKSAESNTEQKVNEEDELSGWEEAKKLDKIGQKQQNIMSELELKIEQISASFKDFEARLNKDKKEISKIYDSLLEINNDEYKQIRTKVHDFYLEIDKLQRELSKSKNQTFVAIAISAISVVMAIVFGLLI